MDHSKQPADHGTLPFTYDFPAYYMEMTEPGNIDRLGPGGAMVLRAVLLAFKQIGEIAIAKNDQPILQVLKSVCIIEE